MIPGTAQYADSFRMSFIANYLMTSVDNAGVWGRSPDGTNKRPNAIYVGTGGVHFSDGTSQATAAEAGVESIPSATRILAGGSMPTDTYHLAAFSPGGAATLGIAGNTAYCTPFAVNKDMLIEDIGVSVFATAAANCRVAIYSNQSQEDPYPDELLANTPAISMAVGGIQMGTLHWQAPSTDIYWAVINTDAGGYSLRGMVRLVVPNVLGVNASISPYTGLLGSMTYANPLPDPFAVTGASLSTSTMPYAIFQMGT